jgi:conjugative transposon TraM protein
METNMYTAKFLKQRRFLMILPLLVVPFLTILFFALGGGREGRQAWDESAGKRGINLKLPDAHFKKTGEKDKLALYEQSNKDSAMRRAAIKNDPFSYYFLDTVLENNDGELQNLFQQSASKYNQRDLASVKKPNSLTNPFNPDTNETRLIKELAKLKNQIGNKTDYIVQNDKNNNGPKETMDLNRLQQMMNSLKQNNPPQSDPEIRQIDKLLEKIMDVQHPERLQDSMRSMALRNRPESLPVSLSDKADSNEYIGFYGFCDEPWEIAGSRSIEAIVEETQNLVSGSLVKMRLLQDIYIAGNCISKDQMIFGIASLAGERLKIAVSSICLHSEILPVSLEVYDLDGLEGIYIPGSITRDVSKESAGEAITSIGPGEIDPSLGAQAASAGIQAAKTLMSKKIKLVRVCVKAGYQIILRDNNRK